MKRTLLMVMSLVMLTAGIAQADAINAGTSVNANGALFKDYAGGGSTPLAAIPGMNTSGWDPSTGLGTFIYTDSGSGARFVDVTINIDLGKAVFWNEYAAFQGSLAAGESAQADTPDFDCDANRCGNIIAETNSNSLDGLNHVPGQLGNYNLDCGANSGGAVNTACNNDVALALGFKYGTPVGDQAVLTFTISNTAPTSGFYIAQTKPQDGDNDPESVYFSGSVAFQPVTSVPEPPSWSLLASAGILLALKKRLRDILTGTIRHS